MATQTVPSSDLRSLAACRIVRPGDEGYADAAASFNPVTVQRPAAVAFPRGAEDVRDLVRGAAQAGLRVALRGGAHLAGPQGSLADAVLIRTSEMQDVAIDPVARRARVGAGVRWEAVVDAAAAHGLVALHGSSPTVGVVGYSLGGGLGWLARKHGLQCNRILAAEVVTPDGSLLTVDEASDPELLWALRGGGGNFGVVCSLEFELFPLAEVYAGALVWDWIHAERVLQAWARWAAHAPDSVTTSARLMQLPPLPEIPEPLRGRQLVMIDGAVDGTEAEGAEVIAGLRALEPEMDTFATMPAAGLARLHGDPEEPTPCVTDTAMIAELTPEAVSAFVAAAGPGSGSCLGVAELRQLGGALARPAVRDGAVSGFDGSFLLFAIGIAATPQMEAAGRAGTGALVAAMAPWTGGRSYLNFVEAETVAARGYTTGDYERLQAIRRRVDPDGVLRAAHVVHLA